MKKTLKILGIALAALVGLLVLAAVTLALVFDPNQYKGDIIRLVKESTGRDLKIDRKIGWSFFPRLGIEAGGLELSNASGFGKQPFAKIDAAGVRVAVLPLLTGKIAVDTVYLHGLDLNLAKNAAGRTNWDDMVAATPAAPKKAEPAPAGATLPIAGLSVGRLEVKRANLAWNDLQSGSRIAVTNLELGTSEFAADRPMDLRLAFALVRDKAAPVKITLKSRLTASRDALELADVDLKLDDSRLRGDIEIRNFAKPALRFDLALDKIDFDRYLAAEPQPAKPAVGTPATAGAEAVELPLSTLRGLDIRGKFGIGELKAIGLHSKDVKIQLNAKDGLISLGPNSAALYGGRYRGETTIDVRGKTPQIRLDEKLEQVQIGPLLKDMQQFDAYTGTGNIAVKLAAQGFDADQIRRSLNGNASIAFRDGRIEGVDLTRMYKTIREKGDALDKLFRVVPQKGDATKFGETTASFQIANGVASNRDLVIRAGELLVTGQGTANLVSEKLDYRLELAGSEDAGKKCKTIPVRVAGPFANLSYAPAVDEILQCKAQKAVEKQLQKGLEQLLQPKKSRKQQLLEQQK